MDMLHFNVFSDKVKVSETKKKNLKTNKENIPTIIKRKKTTKVQIKQQISEATNKNMKQKTAKKTSMTQTENQLKQVKKKNKKKEDTISDSETNISEDDLTIHDSESDLEVTLVDLRI